ncbi:unnamed protein product [Didymodactylos carnosus]|uniref:Tesmin/TSO1-like CXC domain-containing protein n=1 Tax=Didymodactylos carnosus TaxID=1234261 RepID=A0A8S2QNW4_9BILA|nr:unnamed protein product [Didymodactylos carnosus]CAF4110098.1 unnamed protein product [Didymodactylos carnosus]
MDANLIEKWTQSFAFRALLSTITSEICGYETGTNNIDSHRECSPNRLTMDSDDLNLMLTKLKSEKLFCGVEQQFRTLFTGKIIHINIVNNICSSYERGFTIMKKYIEDRLMNSNVKIEDKIDFGKVLRIIDADKYVPDASVSKKVKLPTYNQIEAFIRRLFLISESRMIKLDTLFIHEFSEQPVSLCNKTNAKLLYQSSKSILQKYLQEKFDTEFLQAPTWTSDSNQSALVLDGGLLLQQSPPREQKRTITYYAAELINRFIKDQFNSHDRIDIIFDSGDSKQLKQFIERHSTRTTATQYSMNEDSILCVGEDYNKLLRSNRSVVARAVRDSWLKLYPKLPNGKTMFVAGPDEKTYLLINSDCVIVDDLTSNHIEADTRIFLHIKHISHFENITQVIVQATDTDIIVLAIGFAVEFGIKLYVHCSTSRKIQSKYIDCSVIARRCRDEYKIHPMILIVLHAISGCDTTSFIRNISKQKLFRAFYKQPSDYADLINMYVIPTTPECLSCAERLLINCVNSSLATLDEVRTSQAITHLRSTSSQSFLNILSPTTNSFHYHCKRVAVQCNIWFQSLFNDIDYPELIGNGYTLIDGEVAIEWKSTPSMPDTNLMITCTCHTGCATKRYKCFKHKMKCTILCKCKSCENLHVNSQNVVSLQRLEKSAKKTTRQMGTPDDSSEGGNVDMVNAVEENDSVNEFLTNNDSDLFCTQDDDLRDEWCEDDSQMHEDSDDDEDDVSTEDSFDDYDESLTQQPLSVEYRFASQLLAEYNDDPQTQTDIHSGSQRSIEYAYEFDNK